MKFQPRAVIAAFASLFAYALVPTPAQGRPSAPTIKFIITHPAGGTA